jgi:hypothetical protein
MSDTATEEDTEHKRQAGDQTGQGSGDTDVTDQGKPDEKKAGKGDNVKLNNEFELFPDHPLPHLDNGPIKAYTATNKRDQACVGFICRRDYVPQIEKAEKYHGVVNQSAPTLLDHGVVRWVNGVEYYCFVYADNFGKPLAGEIDGVGLGWSQEHAMKAFVLPMVNILLDMRDLDMVHGNIRITNIYDGGANPVERVVMGDCLTMPTSAGQPAQCETPIRAMADPLGRGLATQANDIYAFGVVLAQLMRKSDPLAGMSADEIIEEKLINGSYAALTGKDRFSGNVLELLRGVLQDDINQRWTIDDIEVWLEGQRLTPKQSSLVKDKAARPIEFNERKYLRPVILAKDLHKNTEDLARIVDNGELKQWINRSLEDKSLEERFDEAVATSREQGRTGDQSEFMATRVAMALSPGFPLMYKDISVLPEGMGPAMVHAYLNNHDITPYIHLITQGLFMFWVNMLSENKLDVSYLVSRFDSCKGFLMNKNNGYGLERVFYYLMPETHCLSDKMQSYFVRTPEDVLYAYEDMAANKNMPERLFDRHIIAFLHIKDSKVIESYFADLSAGEQFRNYIGVIKIFAEIQKRAKLPQFKNLSAYLVDNAAPRAIKRFHDRDFRKSLAKDLEKNKNDGDIVKIRDMLDNADDIKRDYNGFRNAYKTYAALRKEYKQLEKRLRIGEDFGKGTGREIAAVVSGAIAAVFVLAMAFVRFSSGGTGF